MFTEFRQPEPVRRTTAPPVHYHPHYPHSYPYVALLEVVAWRVYTRLNFAAKYWALRRLLVHWIHWSSPVSTHHRLEPMLHRSWPYCLPPHRTDRFRYEQLLPKWSFSLRWRDSGRSLGTSSVAGKAYCRCCRTPLVRPSLRRERVDRYGWTASGPACIMVLNFGHKLVGFYFETQPFRKPKEASLVCLELHREGKRLD